MKLLENFGEYYETNVKSYENKYREMWIANKKETKKQMTIFFGSFILTIILLVITRQSAVILIAIVFGLVSLIKASKSQNQFETMMKREIISPAVRECLKGFEYNERGINRYEFDSSKLYRGYDNFYSSDLLVGNVDNVFFCISEVKLEEEHTDSDGNTSRVTIFNGIYIKMQLDKNFQTEVKIIPDANTKFGRLISSGANKIINLDKNLIELENVDFEKYFKVYSDEPIKARMLLTPQFMEKIVELKTKYKKKISFRFVNNIVYICIDGLKTIDEDKLLKLGLSRGILYSNLKEIEDIMTSIEFIIE